MADLGSIVKEVNLITGGKDYHEVRYYPHSSRQHAGALEVSKVLRKIFTARSIDEDKVITCWYDILCDRGDPNYYMCLNDVLMLGVFYRVENNRDIITHLFIRRLRDYRCPLDKWKDDLQFPSGVRKYSVCAILPQGFVMPEKGERDPHNHAVTQFTWESVRDMGIDIPALVGYLMYGD